MKLLITRKIWILIGILLSNTAFAAELVSTSIILPEEHWPEFNPTSEQLKKLNHRFSGIYGTFHNTKYKKQNNLPYEPLGNYLNAASNGCEHRLLKNKSQGKSYFNPTTSSL